MIMRRIGLMILSAATLALPTSCMKDEVEIDEVSYKRPLNIAAPISVISADYNNILDRLAKSDSEKTPEIKIDDNGMLYVEYNKDYIIDWTNVLALNTVGFSLNLPMPLNKDAKISRTITERIKLNSDDSQRIDSLTISAATMTVKAEPMDASGKITMSIPELYNNGEPFVINWQPASGCDQIIDLTGYNIEPKHSIDSSYLTINISIDGTATSSSLNSTFGFSVSMSEIEPEIVYGFFGTRQVYNSPSVMALDFFDSYEFSDGIEFTGTDITMDVDNWTGTQFDVTMDLMRLVDRDSASSNINFSIENTLYVDQVSHENYRPDGNFKPCSNNFKLDTTNSDVNSLLSIDPISYKYRILVKSNPLGETKENFLTKETSLNCHINMHIPIWMRVDNVDRSDTIDFDLNSIIIDKDNADYVDTLGMYFEFANGFPVSMLAQAYLTDDDMHIVDSLFPKYELLWLLPKFDKNYRISEWGHTSKKAIMDKEKIKRCSDADVKYILLKTIASTDLDSPNLYFKFYDEYGMKMNFSFEVISNYLSN